MNGYERTHDAFAHSPDGERTAADALAAGWSATLTASTPAPNQAVTKITANLMAAIGGTLAGSVSTHIRDCRAAPGELFEPP